MSIVVSAGTVATATATTTAPAGSAASVRVGHSGTAKTLYLVRHAESAMNAYRKSCWTWLQCGCWCCCDPGMRDPALSAAGRAQVSQLAGRLTESKLKERIELIVVSPLRRSIDTAIGAFGADCNIPIHVSHLHRELMDTWGDVGRVPAEIARDYPRLRESVMALPEAWWYFHPARGRDSVTAEPRDVVRARTDEFARWLVARPEQQIAIVGHSMFFKHFAGGSKLDNCAMLTVTLSPDGKLTRS